MKKTLLLVFLAALGMLSVNAQTTTFKGQVLDDSTNGGLAGVSIVVSETKQGLSTGSDGRFSVTVNRRSAVKLVFTYVGYASQTVTAQNGNSLVIRLHKQQSNLDEVVVVGYQSVRRRDLTGSVSSVSAKQLRDVPLSNAAEALTGRLAGVQVTTSEGAPGASVVIRIRGGGSITQDNSPIYIVDGIQVENALNVIAPQDIASVDVLKDASTTAIYGARG